MLMDLIAIFHYRGDDVLDVIAIVLLSFRND